MSIALILAAAVGQSAGGAAFDFAGPPGANFGKGEFRLWYPASPAPVQAVLVLVPGSNGDGRSMADDPFWQDFAARHHLAIVACRFTDKPHDQAFIEHYVNVSQGSGQALVDALADFAERAHHTELASAPLLLWGMSAGGEFNYEFVAWKPERVAAFVVNKGGIYRRGVAHAVARSRDLAAMFFADVLPLRIAGSALKPLDAQSGYVGDLRARTFQPAASAPPQTE